MPSRAPRICGLCNGIHQPGERCSKAVERDRERKARFDAKRPNASARGYDSEWRQQRAAFLAQHPACARCGRKATIVDHIKPHRGNKRLFADRTNWQALCVPCHSSAKQRLERAMERN